MLVNLLVTDLIEVFRSATIFCRQEELVKTKATLKFLKLHEYHLLQLRVQF